MRQFFVNTIQWLAAKWVHGRLVSNNWWDPIHAGWNCLLHIKQTILVPILRLWLHCEQSSSVSETFETAKS